MRAHAPICEAWGRVASEVSEGEDDAPPLETQSEGDHREDACVWHLNQGGRCDSSSHCRVLRKKPRGNGIRFVADYTGVNKALERPPHHFPAPQEVWQRVTAGTKYFIAGDLAAGYWQCELDEESSLLTTCLNEF